MSKVRAQLKITGRVQGVFYRQSTMEMANGLGLTGWAKNCLDGSVEVVFEGDKMCTDKAIEWCKQGPPAARVNNIEVSWLDYIGEFQRFDIRR